MTGKTMAFVEMDLAEKSGCFPLCLSFSRGFSSDTLQASDNLSILPLHLSISFSELPGISAQITQTSISKLLFQVLLLREKPRHQDSLKPQVQVSQSVLKL